MTDRIRHLTVTLDADYRDDDVKSIVEAIRMVRGVVGVEGRVVKMEEHLARGVVRGEIERKLHEAIHLIFSDRKDCQGGHS